MKTLLSILIWISIAVLTITVFVLDIFLMLLSPFDKKRKLIHSQGFWWSDAIVGLNPYWNISIKGRENIDPKATYVVVANHQSMADIIVLYTTHIQFKWVAKESLFKMPIFGWCLSMSKYIKLERGDMGSIKRVYKEAAEWLRKDISVLFFPEGTRSQTTEMKDFQNGAFKLAIKEKKPILPIVINGTHEALPKGGWVFKTKTSATLTVLKPIDTKNFDRADFEKLKDMVRTKMQEI